MTAACSSAPSAGRSRSRAYRGGYSGRVAHALEPRLKTLPAKPGVYLFRDAQGEVLYIGKAKSLRPRVRSYFQSRRKPPRRRRPRPPDRRPRGDRHRQRGGGAPPRANLVKRHRPPFNVRLRDDKSFPYIAVTVEDDYPRVMFTRERHRRGVVYFGPYANAKKVRETLDVLNRVFRFRPCEGPQPGRHSGIPCLDYHIDRCLAPCVGYVSKEDYAEIIDGVVQFLSGDTKSIQRELEQQMLDAAALERFEDAARYRNRLFAVRHLAERQAADRARVGTIDVIGSPPLATAPPCRSFRSATASSSAGTASISRTWRARTSRPCWRRSCSSTTARRRACRLRSSCRPRARHRGARGVPVRAARPRRGASGAARREAAAAGAATQNAQLALETDAAATEQRRLRRVEALEELREALNLESLPVRIECFDISNIQAESPVGSMVVFSDGVPKKAHYRKFGLASARRARRLRGHGVRSSPAGSRACRT